MSFNVLTITLLTINYRLKLRAKSYIVKNYKVVMYLLMLVCPANLEYWVSKMHLVFEIWKQTIDLFFLNGVTHYGRIKFCCNIHLYNIMQDAKNYIVCCYLELFGCFRVSPKEPRGLIHAQTWSRVRRGSKWRLW